MPELAIRAVLDQASRQLGLFVDDATPIHQHSHLIYLLPREQVVARISTADPTIHQRTLTLLQWLVEQRIPVTEPASAHPVTAGDHTATFWRYYPQPAAEPPGAGSLAALLRRVHALPPPPVALPTYRPLTSLTLALESTDILPAQDHRWLRHHASALQQQYAQMPTELGTGLVHADAYPGNLLWGADEHPILGDWDEAAVAPRELDLANTYQGVRFGRDVTELDAFAREYGWDIRQSPTFPVLRAMRDVHTLASYLYRAPHDPAARAELLHRIHTLRSNQTDGRWHAT